MLACVTVLSIAGLALLVITSRQLHQAMFALFAAYYNFCRKHQTLKATPAAAAGLADGQWTLERLLEESAKSMAA